MAPGRSAGRGRISVTPRNRVLSKMALLVVAPKPQRV
jgi:hypothetical protein